MRILYVITRSEPGGAQMHVLDLIQGLPPSFETAVVTGEEGFLADRARSLGSLVFCIPELKRSMHPYRDTKAAWKIWRIIKTFQPDLIHAHTFKAGVTGRLAAFFADVPSLYTAHGWQFASGTPSLQKLVAFPGELVSAVLGDGVVTVSRYDSRLAARTGVTRRGKTWMIRNGVPDSPLRADPGGETTVNIVMVGRFAEQKDHLLLLHALRHVQGAWELRLVGDGPTKQKIEAETQKLCLTNRVHFLGARSDVPEILAASQIFVLASFYEGLPLSVLEAMRAGLPTVVTDVGGIRDCVFDGRTGFVVRPQDREDMRSALQTLIESRTLRRQMGSAARVLYERSFTSERMLAKTLAVYSRVTYFPALSSAIMKPA